MKALKHRPHAVHSLAIEAMHSCKNNRREAARLLGLGIRDLYRIFEYTHYDLPPNPKFNIPITLDSLLMLGFICKGNRRKMAEHVNVTETTVYNWLKKYGVTRDVLPSTHHAFWKKHPEEIEAFIQSRRIMIKATTGLDVPPEILVEPDE